jgi:hypothetical protein
MVIIQNFYLGRTYENRPRDQNIDTKKNSAQ